MKRKLDLGAVIALMLMVATVTWLIADWQITARVNGDLTETNRMQKEFEKVKQAKQYIESSFIGSWDEEKLLDGAVSGMVESLGDRWSVYLNAEEFQNNMAASNNMFASVEEEPVRSQILTGDNEGIGLVRIKNFNTGTDIAFTEAVTNLKLSGVTGIIFDLRSNPGGQLKVMLPMLDLLLPEGVLFRMREKSGAETVHESDVNSFNLPMMVIVNGESYSAAEYFAAALKEYGWADIVGQPTTGKGYAQVPLELKDGSGIILSTNEYFTPQGKSLADIGLTPDYPVSMTAEQTAQIGTLAPEQDPQVMKAIEVIKTKITEPEPDPAAAETAEQDDAETGD